MAEFEKCRDPECPVLEAQRLPRPHCHPVGLPRPIDQHPREVVRPRAISQATAIGDVRGLKHLHRSPLVVVDTSRDPAPIFRAIAALARNRAENNRAKIIALAENAADIFEEERRAPGIA